MRVLGWVAGAGLMMAAAGLAAQQVQTKDQAEKEQLAKQADKVMAQMVAQLNPCPVGFRAEVDPRLTMREVKNGRKDPDSTLVQLSFTPVDVKKTVVAANVTAHGIAPHGQFMQVDERADENRTQAFELTRGRAAGLWGSEIEVTAMPFVRWVELNQVTYADGSVWHAAEGATCKAELSKFHYVSAQ